MKSRKKVIKKFGIFFNSKKKNEFKNLKNSVFKILFINLVALIALLFLIISGFLVNSTKQKFGWNIDKIQYIPAINLFFCSFGLAVVGGALQGITRNDLSGPTTLGFLPAVILGVNITNLISYNNKTKILAQSGAMLFILGIVFGFLMLLINFVLTWKFKNKKNNHVPLIVGFVVGVVFSVITLILTNYFIALQNTDYTANTIFGLVLHLSTQIKTMIIGLPFVIVLSIVIMFLANQLNLIEKDPILAKTMGLNVNLLYWSIGIMSVIIVACSFVLVGSLMMIGIVAPHIVRRILKTNDYKYVLPISGLISSFVMLFSYMIISIDRSFSINFVPLLLCAPVFVILLKRR